MTQIKSIQNDHLAYFLGLNITEMCWAEVVLHPMGWIPGDSANQVHWETTGKLLEELDVISEQAEQLPIAEPDTHDPCADVIEQFVLKTLNSARRLLFPLHQLVKLMLDEETQPNRKPIKISASDDDQQQQQKEEESSHSQFLRFIEEDFTPRLLQIVAEKWLFSVTIWLETVTEQTEHPSPAESEVLRRLMQVCILGMKLLRKMWVHYKGPFPRVIGGDNDASGPFHDALAVIQKGRLREAGIEEIGIAAYPEGHGHIPPGRLEAALDEKTASAIALGLKVHIVSQFSFSPDRVTAWLRQLRGCGIATPVKVGMAGPTSVPALLRYAKRCGVAASLRGLMSGAATGLVGHIGPDRMIDALAGADGQHEELGDIAPHYFSFGGVVETADYACEAARGTAGASRAMSNS